MMRSNPEVSLQFLERQTALSAAVIEQFLNGSMVSQPKPNTPRLRKRCATWL